ncbi:hypothetical protein MTO96_001957 [Rhipicephalus appendiculatus]
MRLPEWLDARPIVVYVNVCEHPCARRVLIEDFLFDHPGDPLWRLHLVTCLAEQAACPTRHVLNTTALPHSLKIS